jgi:hypothetical protein
VRWRPETRIDGYRDDEPAPAGPLGKDST